MSLASNPWPSFDQADTVDQGTRTSRNANEMINQAATRQPPPRYRPNPLHMTRSTSHDTGWNNGQQHQQHQQQQHRPTVGVVQPMNAAIRTQPSEQQQHKYKALNRRHIPQVPPRNDQAAAAPNVKDFTAYKEQLRKQQQQQQQQQPASDPWKATAEQKKYYGDEVKRV